MVYSLLHKSLRTGTKNFAKLYEQVPNADNIGLNLGAPFTVSLCTLGSPYIIPGCEPIGYKKSN